MTIVELVENSPVRRIAINAGAREVVGRRLMRLTVVSLQSKQVICPLIEDLLCDCRLAPHRIQCHDAVLDHQLLKQRWDGGDLVRLAVHAALTQDQALVARPRAYQVQRVLLAATVE